MLINIKTVVLFAIILLAYSCKPNDPVVPALKPVVTIQPVESVTTTSAIIVVLVVPNEDNTIVSAMYSLAASDNWTTVTSDSKYSGTEAKKVTLLLSSLQPNTKYDYKVTATNKAGSVTSTISSFATSSYTKAIAVIKPVINLKINSVTLVGMITANQDASTVSFEFKPSANTDWQSQSLTTAYSGSDSTQVSLDLSSLSANTSYDYRVKVVNKAGEVVSGVNSFKTYAVTDYDGNYYHTITIGTQTWLQENLKTIHYANGDPIPHVTDPTAWDNLTTGAYCQYNNDPENGEVYGNLYNWYVGTDPRGLIIGWHTPTVYEFITLGNYLGGGIDTPKAGPMMMETGKAHWVNTSPYNPPTNSSGFTALPNGAFAPYMDTNDWVYMNIGEIAGFWTTTSEGLISAQIVEISRDNCFLTIGNFYHKTIYCGLRLVKNG